MLSISQLLIDNIIR